MEEFDQIQTGGSDVGALLKRDTGGRIRYSPEFKAEVIRAYRASSMSAASFARHCGVKYPTFASWVRKDDEQKGAKGYADRQAGDERVWTTLLAGSRQCGEPGGGGTSCGSAVVLGIGTAAGCWGVQ